MGTNGLKRPQFLAESLANKVIGGDLVRVEVTGENPTHDQPEINDGVHLQGVHEIDAYGFAQGKSHGLIVFNYGLHQSRRISLEGPGINATTQANVWRIISPGPGASNEVSPQVRIVEDHLRGTDLDLAPCSMVVLEWAE
jgi:hypothetical protein